MPSGLQVLNVLEFNKVYLCYKYVRNRIGYIRGFMVYLGVLFNTDVLEKVQLQK